MLKFRRVFITTDILTQMDVLLSQDMGCKDCDLFFWTGLMISLRWSRQEKQVGWASGSIILDGANPSDPGLIWQNLMLTDRATTPISGDS